MFRTDRLDARDQENLKEQTRSTGGMVKMVSLLTSIDQVDLGIVQKNQKEIIYLEIFQKLLKKEKYGDLDSLDNSDMPF